MRHHLAVLAVLILLIAISALFRQAAAPATPGPAALDGWRRTSAGWSVYPAPEPPPAKTPWRLVHPLVIASLQVLVSVAALLSWPPRTRQPAAQGTTPAGRPEVLLKGRVTSVPARGAGE